jgi:NAD(P)-dependent dehydrogenase (short-subunit alcohol dehydrogenase family)
MQLIKKIIVVTGGAGLLGTDFCEAITEQGGLAIVADIDLPAAEIIAEQIRSNGGKAEAESLDITNEVSIANLIRSVHERFGTIDAVVNNAYPRNKNWGRKLEDVTYGDFCENINLHLGGYFLVAQKFAIYFRTHGGGNIINMGSIYGTMAPRFDIYRNTSMTMPVEYAAIKSGVIQMSKYFAQYFKSDGIRCNSLSPGGILDNQPESFPKAYGEYCGTKGMLNASDISNALVFLLSDESKYMNGQNIIIDDAFSL